MVGGKVFLKAENLQRIGSFKIRGAYNLLSQLTPEQATKGVIAFSSGNHAQAVAAAGTMLGIETTIVMPEDAPRIKIENTRKLGGITVLYDRYTGDRETIAREMAAERGCEVVPSYDHEHIIAGQGTAGLEIVEQCEEAGVVPDQVFINCSGGGLTAGCAIAIKSQFPKHVFIRSSRKNMTILAALCSRESVRWSTFRRDRFVMRYRLRPRARSLSQLTKTCSAEAYGE